MITVTISPKFQIIIPKAIRKKLNLKPGQKLQIFQVGKKIEFIPVKNIRDARGFLKGMNTSIEREGNRV